jgi:hypothetical protein
VRHHDAQTRRFPPGIGGYVAAADTQPIRGVGCQQRIQYGAGREKGTRTGSTIQWKASEDESVDHAPWLIVDVGEDLCHHSIGAREEREREFETGQPTFRST